METEERPKFVTMRMADLPQAAVPSVMRNCERCQEPVYVDARNLEALAELNGEIVCNRCILPDLLRADTVDQIALIGGEQYPVPDDIAEEFVEFSIEREISRGKEGE
jgi:hypothetical protein